MSMFNLASGYSELGRYRDALKLQQECLEYQKRYLEDDHPDVELTMQAMVQTYSNLDRHEECLVLAKRVLAMREKRYPRDHPRMISSLGDVALAYDSVGRYKEGLELNLEVLALRRRVFGPNHPELLFTMNNTAQSYTHLNMTAEAISMFEDVLATTKRIHPPYHPNVSKALNGLAAAYAKVGRFHEAIPLFEQSLTLLQRTMPSDHEYISQTMKMISLCYRMVGDTKKAREVKRDTSGYYTCGHAMCKVPLIEDELLTCSGCKKVCYCSKKCQVAAWKGGHKKACKDAQQAATKTATAATSTNECSSDGTAASPEVDVEVQRGNSEQSNLHDEDTTPTSSPVCSYKCCVSSKETASSKNQSVASAAMSLCGGCGMVSYCSKACQVAHWKDGHKVKCKEQRQARNKNDKENDKPRTRLTA
jgi:tetratricopeptide (TPR) repeat protein